MKGVPVDLFARIMNIICEEMDYKLVSQEGYNLLIAFIEEMDKVNKKGNK